MNIRRVKCKLLENIEELKSPIGYLNAGHPRYNTLFGRDSLISAWQMLKIDTSIARSTLETLARYQGKVLNPQAEEEPGKILHEYRFDSKSQKELPDWDFPYYGSVDSTPLFIILAGEYFKQTRNTERLLRIWNNIIASFMWIRRWGDLDNDGYVEYIKKNPHGLFHQGWKDGVNDHLKIQPPVAIVEVQGYIYAAYRTLAFLEKELDKYQATEIQIAPVSKSLKNKFNKDFWVKNQRYFALALNGEKRRKESVTSNPGHLLFTGIVAQNKMCPLVSRLFQSDLWTPYGIRTSSTQDAEFDPFSYHRGSVWPYDNWIICKGLQHLHFDLHANRIKKALLQTFRELGRIPEFYAVENNRIVDLTHKKVKANPLQAWSVAGLLDLIWED